jgi:hypothetical protein
MNLVIAVIFDLIQNVSFDIFELDLSKVQGQSQIEQENDQNC